MSFRLSESEEAVFLEKVRASGLSSSEFLRACVLEGRDTVEAENRTRFDILRLLYVLKKADQFLIQIASRVERETRGELLPTNTQLSILTELSTLESLLLREIKNVD